MNKPVHTYRYQIAVNLIEAKRLEEELRRRWYHAELRSADYKRAMDSIREFCIHHSQVSQ